MATFTGSSTMVYDFLPSPMPTPTSFVLLHGLGMGRAIYREFAGELNEFGEVYALDLPGFGDSPEPEQAGSMADTAEVVAQFITELQIANPVLIGHSMGTQVLAELAVRHREMSNRIVFIAPTVNRDERTVGRQMLRMLQDLTGESLRLVLRGLRQYLKTGVRWYLKKLRPLLSHDVESLYPQIQAEVLVLYGERDRVCPERWSRTVAQAIPNARLGVIPGRGHEAVITNPQPAVQQIVEQFVDPTDAEPKAQP